MLRNFEVALLLLLLFVGSCVSKKPVVHSKKEQNVKEAERVLGDMPETKGVEKIEVDKIANENIQGGDFKVTLNFRSIKLINVLKALSKQTGINFITKEEHRDLKLSAYLVDVLLLDALEALLSTHGLVFEQFESSSIYIIKERTEKKPRVITKIFRLEHVQIVEGGRGDSKSSKSGISIVSGGGGESASGGGEKKEGGESGIISVIRSILSENGSIMAEPFTNSVIVTDLPERFPQIESLIKHLDVIIPQIYLESEIVELSTDAIRNIGVDYGLPDGTMAKIIGPSRTIQYPSPAVGDRIFPVPSDLVGADVKGTSDYGISKASGTHYGILSLAEFQVIMRAIELSGEGKFLARPKILTLNNKTASLSVTEETAVGVQSASVIASTGLVVSAAERQTTGIVMNVTPQINNDGYITLLIEPVISRPRSSKFFPGQFVDPQSTSLSTSVRIKDGETVMIGGLYSTEESESIRKIPLLGDIPILGWLFKSVKKTLVKRELMIFLSPRRVAD